MKISRSIVASMMLLVAAQLSGCGGGGEDETATNTGNGGGGGGGGGVTGNLTGLFLDSPVQGLKYTATPSNLTGTTNAAGQYNYRAGDTVTFALGDLVLGSVPAAETVTPATVAQAIVAANPSADAETITVNMLVFLQSLDADGDADNGITITTAVAGAMTSNAVSFVADAGTFTTSITTLVTSVETATGTNLTVVSREDAAEHFVEQSPTLVAGTYVWATEGGVPVTQNTRTLTLFENGRYLYGGHDSDPNCNGTGNHEDADGNGVEFGTYAFNPLTHALTFTRTFETNGSCGPETAADEPLILNIVDNVLQIDDDSEISYWVPVPSTVGTAAGSWLLPIASLNGRPLVVSFFSTSATTGRYFMVDAMLATPDLSDNTSSGIEEGCYTLAANGAFTVNLNPATCTGAVDTNDTAGLSHPHAPYTVEVDAHGRFRVSEGPMGGEETSDLVRLPLQATAHADRVGTYYIEQDGVTPQENPNLFVVSLFADGKYLMGGVHDDSSCDNLALSYQDANGNGAEFGQLTPVVNALHGVITAAATVDSNGECGLVDANQPAQRFMLVPSELDGSLLVFPWDESQANVLTKVPSVANSIVGAWLMDDLDAANPHLGVFLPGGVMFEVSAATSDESGLWRSRYSLNVNQDQFTLTSGGEGCVDTMGFDSCTPDDEVEILDFSLTGTAMQLDVYGYTKITP